MGLILPNSCELLLALEIASVRAEALLKVRFHVENSPLDNADMRVVELIDDALCLLLKGCRQKPLLLLKISSSSSDLAGSSWL